MDGALARRSGRPCAAARCPFAASGTRGFGPGPGQDTLVDRTRFRRRRQPHCPARPRSESGLRSIRRAGSRSVRRAGSRSVRSVRHPGPRSVRRAGSRSVCSVRHTGSRSVRSVRHTGPRSVRRTGSRSVRRVGSRFVRRAGSRSVRCVGSRSVRPTTRGPGAAQGRRREPQRASRVGVSANLHRHVYRPGAHHELQRVEDGRQRYALPGGVLRALAAGGKRDSR